MFKRLLLVATILINSSAGYTLNYNPSIFLITDVTESYTGTAFEVLINGKKVTLTNHHVCQGMRQDQQSTLIAVLPDPRRFKVLIVKRIYDKNDLCLLSGIDSLPALELANDYEVGDVVTVEGFPLGKHNVVKGIVGKLMGSVEQLFIAFKGPVFPGNSGSPVIDKHGKVIGVIAVRDGTTGIGGFVSLEFVKDFLDNSCKQ